MPAMGCPKKSMNALFLLIVVLRLVVSTHGFSGHRSREDMNPSFQASFEGAGHPTGFQKPRLTNFRFQQVSAHDLQRAAYQEDSTVSNSRWRKNEALVGPGGAQTWTKDRSRLRVTPLEVGTGETPVAKPWPEKFTVNFTTKSGAATGFMAYDWSQKRQIVFHGPKSTYCSAFGTDDACQMFEIPGGTYTKIPSLEQCFLSVADVGSLPPDWTTKSDYVGVEEVPGVGLCRSFAFPPTAHVWYETVVGSLPCLFVFPEPTSSYYFLPETFEVGTADDKYFDFPDYCFSEGFVAIQEIV